MRFFFEGVKPVKIYPPALDMLFRRCRTKISRKYICLLPPTPMLWRCSPVRRHQEDHGGRIFLRMAFSRQVRLNRPVRRDGEGETFVLIALVMLSYPEKSKQRQSIPRTYLIPSQRRGAIDSAMDYSATKCMSQPSCAGWWINVPNEPTVSWPASHTTQFVRILCTILLLQIVLCFFAASGVTV